MRRPVKGFYALPLDRINHTNEANLSASLSVMMGEIQADVRDSAHPDTQPGGIVHREAHFGRKGITEERDFF